MEQSKIDRINELARKSKIEPLTEEEKAEQKVLRDEYIMRFRNNLETQLQDLYGGEKKK